MSLVVAVTVGTLFAMGTYLLLRDSVVQVIWGVAIITQAVNVFLISMGGIRSGQGEHVPILPAADEVGPNSTAVSADPVVQALVLTAIVISFGMTAFVLVLAYRAYQENESMDLRAWSR